MVAMTMVKMAKMIARMRMEALMLTLSIMIITVFLWCLESKLKFLVGEVMDGGWIGVFLTEAEARNVLLSSYCLLPAVSRKICIGA